MVTLFHCPNGHDSRILDTDTPVSCGACDAPMKKGKFGKPSPFTPDVIKARADAKLAKLAGTPAPSVPVSGGRADRTPDVLRATPNAVTNKRSDTTRTTKAKRATVAKKTARVIKHGR
jgi:hypothetical protein